MEGNVGGVENKMPGVPFLSFFSESTLNDKHPERLCDPVIVFFSLKAVVCVK